MTSARELEPSAYDQLLNALGDSVQSRTLIDSFARHLAQMARQAEATQYPGPVADVIDPFQHTLQTWAAVTGCARNATPAPEQPAGDVRTTVEFFVQTEQPDGTWEQSTGVEQRAFWGAERLRKLRKRFPDMVHRIVQRTTTVRVQPIAEGTAAEPDRSST